MWPNPQETAELVTFTDDILHGKHAVRENSHKKKNAIENLVPLNQNIKKVEKKFTRAM